MLITTIKCIRIEPIEGIGCGPLVCGVIGARKPVFDVWGNTVSPIQTQCQHTKTDGSFRLTKRHVWTPPAKWAEFKSRATFIRYQHFFLINYIQLA